MRHFVCEKCAELIPSGEVGITGKCECGNKLTVISESTYDTLADTSNHILRLKALNKIPKKKR